MTRKNADFTFIRYSNCWEDADLLFDNLKPQPGERILSIASAGDNSLGFLAFDPEHVLAFDINSTQLYLSELKQKAIECLEYEDCLKFLGVNDADNRAEYFERIKPKLSAEAAGYFSHHIKLIEAGIIHTGKFENYFKLFRNYVLPLIHSKKTTNELFISKSAELQMEFYHKTWNNRRWGWLFKLFFSRTVMGRFGRDPSFFNEVKINVGDEIFKRAENHLSSVNVFRNHFLEYQLMGKFRTNLPFYLRSENYQKIKSNIQKIKFVKASLTDIPENKKFDCFNLSNIFEYMNPGTFQQQVDHLRLLSGPQSRIGYWNLLVERELADVDSGFIPDDITGDDLCFFYQTMQLNTFKH